MLQEVELLHRFAQMKDEDDGISTIITIKTWHLAMLTSAV